jgi:serine protease Do
MRQAKLKCWLSCATIISLCLLASCQLLAGIATTSPTPTPSPSPIEPSWSLPPAEGQAPVLPSIADVVARVKPSVVAINTEVVTYDIFNRPLTQQGAASGWIIGESGIIVTNNHVVEGAHKVSVTLSDGRVFQATNINTDPLTDLAVLKVDAGNLPAAPTGDSSKLRVGDWVVAIGNPLGLGISAKEGIVGRLGVPLEVSTGQTLYDLIETSAAINPGNSGGPLVNMSGQVIGITSAKIATVGVEGMGYAININSAQPIIEQLVNPGYVVRPWLGVVFYTVDEWVAASNNLAVNKGALITEVAGGSPADKAGIQQGDVVVAFDDAEITNSQDLVQAIRYSQIGKTVSITFWRGNNKNTTSATLIESPSP